MKSDEEVIRDQDDVEYLKRPHLWQRVQMPDGVKRTCPLNRMPEGGQGFDDLQVGCVMQTGEPPLWTVFLINLFLLPSIKQLQAVEREIYTTPEELYEAGWRVD